MGRDAVIINGFRVSARIGAQEEERKQPQVIELDVEMTLDTSEAARTKKLAYSICYQDAMNQLANLIHDREWVLLEELAEVSADYLLRRYPALLEARILAKKLLFADAKWAGVRIERCRKDGNA